MTTPRAQGGRGTWVLIAAAIVVGLLIAAAIVYFVNRGDDGAAGPAPTTPPVVTLGPTGPPPASSSGTAPTAEPSAGARTADGCLGGDDPFAAILVAQQSAPLTSDGAAAFARTVARWSAAYPIDPAAPEVIKQIATPDGTLADSGVEDLNDSARGMRDKGYTEATVIPEKSLYRVLPKMASETEGALTRAQLSIRVYRQQSKADGTVDEVELSTDVILEAVNGKWTVWGSGPPAMEINSPDALEPAKPFTGVC